MTLGKGHPLMNERAPSGADQGLHEQIRALFLKGEAVLLAKYPNIPADWRGRLPTAETYYQRHVPALGQPNARGWALGCCPFHDGEQISLAVSVCESSDTWACFGGCGLGDLIDFHKLLTGFGFELAVLDLLGIRK